ncbi:hypothetical protein BHM03_00031672 [Ensete ventricosum]|nr:hypothetical protein BHM03_00031672 [Ensete ventricosum]
MTLTSASDHPINAERFPPIVTASCCRSPRSVQIVCLEKALFSPLHQTRPDTKISVDHNHRRLFYIKRLPLLFPLLIGKKCFGKRKALLFDDCTSSSTVFFRRATSASSATVVGSPLPTLPMAPLP